MSNETFQEEAERLYPITVKSFDEEYLTGMMRKAHITARQIGQAELEAAKREIERLKGNGKKRTEQIAYNAQVIIDTQADIVKAKALLEAEREKVRKLVEGLKYLADGVAGLPPLNCNCWRTNKTIRYSSTTDKGIHNLKLKDMEANEEVWKSVSGYEGLYEVSNMGGVRSLDRVTIRPNGSTRTLKGRLMKVWASKARKGYMYPRVSLTDGKNEKTWLVHILVARAFVSNPYNKPFVNHIDGNKLNADYKNLEWVTMSENARHAFKTGLNRFAPYLGINGERSRNCKLRNIDVIMIRIMFNNGYGMMELSKMFSVDRMTVSNIVHDKIWKHLPLTSGGLPVFSVPTV